MKNSDLDMSMPNTRSPKASLFATHLFSILLNAKFYFINNTKAISVEENTNLAKDVSIPKTRNSILLLFAVFRNAILF